jgi:hypothetical protein
MGTKMTPTNVARIPCWEAGVPVSTMTDKTGTSVVVSCENESTMNLQVATHLIRYRLYEDQLFMTTPISYSPVDTLCPLLQERVIEIRVPINLHRH